MNKPYISEAFDTLHEMQNKDKNKQKEIIKKSASIDELINMRVDYENILGYWTEDEEGQDVFVKYNTHTKECVVYQRDSSGLPVIIRFSEIPLNIYNRKARKEYMDELPSSEGKYWYTDVVKESIIRRNPRKSLKEINRR